MVKYMSNYVPYRLGMKELLDIQHRWPIYPLP